MGVITISRGSYSKGKEIAEKLARHLGYECISRDILLETSAHFNIHELKLVRAIHDAPSILERLKHGKEKYINFIREAFFDHIRRDNVVYHGLAGHFFCQRIPGILKVRINANWEDRIKEEVRQEHISEKEARHILKKDDEERRKWSLYLYGIDNRDPALYDIVLHIDNLKVDDAVEILADIAKRPCFKTTQESQMVIDDYHIAAKVQETLFDRFPSAQVKCKNGAVFVTIETALSQEQEIINKIIYILKGKDIAGIKDVRVNTVLFDSGD
jgi:cytidylate kinase